MALNEMSAEQPQGDAPETAPTRRSLIKNSAANVITGVSTTLLTVVVPPALARTLSTTEFGTWTLILQIAAYTSLLNLGMQSAVGRYVSYHLARGDRRSGAEFVSTAFATLSAAAMVGLLGVMVAASLLRELFPAIPGSLLGPARFCLCAVGGVLALALPVSVFNGVFTGIQRNELVAVIVGPTRALLAVALVAGAILSHTMTTLADIFVVLNLSSFWATWICFRKLSPVQVTASLITRGAFTELVGYCASLMVWNIAMLLISGVDTAIVGRVDFERVAVYGACLAPVTVLAGMQQALFGPLMQVGAVQCARGDREGQCDTLIRATRLGALALLVPVMTLLLFSREILWLGAAYARQAVLVFPLLLIGHAIRLVAMPYSTLLLAAGEHHRVVVVPLIEGLVNVVVAVLAGMRFGAPGVATGVIVGALLSQLLNYFYNLPRTHGPGLQRDKLLRQALVVPGSCCLPAMLGIVGMWVGSPLASSVTLRLLLLAVSLALAWVFALEPAEKALAAGLLRKTAFAMRA
jgi:O-antigen/teichoic acid export membrane protein